MASDSIAQDYINGDVGILTTGTPVCFKADGSIWAARADSQARSRVVGIVRATGGPTLPVTIVQMGVVWTPNLIPGAVYFLGSTGGITLDAPSTPGHSITEIGVASSAYSLDVLPRQPILL